MKDFTPEISQDRNKRSKEIRYFIKHYRNLDITQCKGQQIKNNIQIELQKIRDSNQVSNESERK